MILQLPLPPSANRLWRSLVIGGKVRVVKSAEYQTWLKTARLQALTQGGSRTVPSPVVVKIAVCGKVNRSSDLDNRIKPVLDLLKAVGAIADDNLNHVVEVRIYAARSEAPPSLQVTVEREV